MNSQLTNSKYAPQATETVMGFQIGKNNKNTTTVYLILLMIVAVVSPFLHLIYLINDKEGLFGYAYMSSFLFSLSLPMMAISSGLLLKYASTRITDHFKKPINYISNTIIFVGFFFFIYTFIPMNDFSLTTYYLSLTALSIILTALAHYLHQSGLTAEQRLKIIISKLFDFIILETPRKHVSEEKQIEYVISYEKIINEIGDE